MAKKEETKLCLDEIGNILQIIGTTEDRDYSVIINKGLQDEREEVSSYAETVRSLADTAAIQFLDQLYDLLEIEANEEVIQ